MSLDLPPAVPRPCNDCPWRRVASPGWLGPHEPETWLAIAHGEEPIACHQTIPVMPETDPDDYAEHPTLPFEAIQAIWRDPGIRQCAGAAIFRCNVHKSPRNRQDAERAFEADPMTVFATDEEFLAHHRRLA